MNRRTLGGLSSVLSFVCLCASAALVWHVMGFLPLYHGEKFGLGLLAVVSGYAAACLTCLRFDEPARRKRVIRFCLWLIFAFYAVMVIDFTLIDGSLGRDIQNVFSWDKTAFQTYMKESTNFIPFATVRLFINGYRDGNLTFISTFENLLGNLAVLMPIPFFLNVLGKRPKSMAVQFVVVLAVSLAIELLQFVFLTGATDIDDVILNAAGAMLFAALLKNRRISRGISNLTFGMWKTVEGKT